MAYLPDSRHGYFLKIFDVSNTNQTILISIRIPIIEFLTKFGLKSSCSTLLKATFLKYPFNTEKMAILPDSGHAKFLKFLSV